MGYLDVAAGEVGYAETPNNITKYWADLNPSFQGQPWCFAFVSWCLKEAGSLGAIGGAPMYYCPSGVAKARAAGQWFNEPVAGALVFYNFGSNTAVHIEFVESVGTGSITTIGGNTSSGSGGSQANGGGVYRRTRSSGIMGYWHISGSAGGGGSFTPGIGVRTGVGQPAAAQTITGEAAGEPGVRFVYGR